MGLLPGAGAQAPAVLPAIQHFTNLRIGVIFKEVTELRVVGHCPPNPAVAGGWSSCIREWQRGEPAWTSSGTGQSAFRARGGPRGSQGSVAWFPCGRRVYAS